MNFAEILREKTDEINVIKKEVVDEIVDKFNNYLNNGNFENYLKKIITDSDLEKGYKTLYSEFWQYQSGCSGTNFTIAGFKFRNKEVSEYSFESNYYKGIELKSIQKEVIDNCLNHLYTKLEEMGFKYKCEKYEIHKRFNLLQVETKIMW